MNRRMITSKVKITICFSLNSRLLRSRAIRLNINIEFSLWLMQTKQFPHFFRILVHSAIGSQAWDLPTRGS